MLPLEDNRVINMTSPVWNPDVSKAQHLQYSVFTFFLSEETISQPVAVAASKVIFTTKTELRKKLEQGTNPNDLCDNWFIWGSGVSDDIQCKIIQCKDYHTGSPQAWVNNGYLRCYWPAGRRWKLYYCESKTKDEVKETVSSEVAGERERMECWCGRWRVGIIINKWIWMCLDVKQGQKKNQRWKCSTMFCYSRVVHHGCHFLSNVRTSERILRLRQSVPTIWVDTRCRAGMANPWLGSHMQLLARFHAALMFMSIFYVRVFLHMWISYRWALGTKYGK